MNRCDHGHVACKFPINVTLPYAMGLSSGMAMVRLGGRGAEEDTMSYPTIDIGKKKIILLSGFERTRGANKPLDDYGQGTA